VKGFFIRVFRKFWSENLKEMDFLKYIYKRRWKNNIEIDVKEMVWESVNRILLDQNGDKWQDVATR
jgi:hypothetical protein